MNLTDPAAAAAAPNASPASPFAGIPMAAPRLRDAEDFAFPPEFTPGDGGIPVRQLTITVRSPTNPGGQRVVLLGVSFVLLTPEEDKRAAVRAGMNAENGMVLAVYKAVEAMRVLKVAPIETKLDTGGQPVESFSAAHAFDFPCSTADGTAEAAYSEMHPAIRELIVLGYATSSSVGQNAAALFAKSRRPTSR